MPNHIEPVLLGTAASIHCLCIDSGIAIPEQDTADSVSLEAVPHTTTSTNIIIQASCTVATVPSARFNMPYHNLTR